MCVQHGKARVDHGVEYSVGFSGNVLMFQSRQWLLKIFLHIIKNTVENPYICQQ